MPMATYPAPTQVYDTRQNHGPMRTPEFIATPPHLPYLGAEGQPAQPVSRHTMPTGYERVYVEAPVPRHKGGHELRHMPPMEMNVTKGPTGYLDVDPRGRRTKEWFNTYVYVPEPPRGGEDPQFLNRFERAEVDDEDYPENTYLDNYAVEKKYQFYEEKVRGLVRKLEEDSDARAGVGVSFLPNWYDQYTGAPVIESRKQLVNKEEFMHKHGVRASDWEEFKDYYFAGWDYGELRVPWPFETGELERNKMVTPSAMAFERRSPVYVGDRAFRIGAAEHSYYHDEGGAGHAKA
jgi:hypothetical protein